jgi:hypothetical protein
VKPVRLVTTGLDRQGKSTIAADTQIQVSELPTGRLRHPLWSTDHVTAGTDRAGPAGLFPGPGGARFWLFTVRAHDPGDAGDLHATPTTDLGIVLTGTLTLRLEDGSEATLSAGDAYVQNGTRHG